MKVEILYLEIKSGVTCNDSCKVQTYLFTVLFKVFHGVPLWLLPTETPHWRTPSLNMAPKASEQSLLSLRWVVLVQFRGAGRKIAQPAQCGIDSSPPHQLSSYKLTNWRRQTIPLRLSANWKLCKFQNTCFNMDFWALLFLPCAGWATLLWKWSFYSELMLHWDIVPVVSGTPKQGWILQLSWSREVFFQRIRLQWSTNSFRIIFYVVLSEVDAKVFARGGNQAIKFKNIFLTCQNTRDF